MSIKVWPYLDVFFVFVFFLEGAIDLYFMVKFLTFPI